MPKEDVVQNYLKNKEKEWELLCGRCGGCCGAFDDPCMHLKKESEDRYRCEIYYYRWGVHKTVNGEELNCVPIKEIIHTSWKKDWRCAYKKIVR